MLLGFWVPEGAPMDTVLVSPSLALERASEYFFQGGEFSVDSYNTGR